MRHGTKQGFDWISKHQFDVLQMFMQDEARDAMAKSAGEYRFVSIEIGELEVGLLP